MSIVVKQNGQLENNIAANVQLYSMRGLVSRNPGIMIKIALPIFLLVIVVMTAIGWFVKYPEIIKANTIVTGKNNNGLYDIELGLQQENMHKIKPQQRVRLQFAEQGYVEGTVAKVVDSVKLQVQLPRGLVTDHGRQIQYRPGLHAESIFFIKDLRLLQRMLRSSSRIFQ